MIDMKFFNSRIIKYAIVHTDIGHLRVSENGLLDVWKFGWRPLEEGDLPDEYSIDDLYEIRKHGLNLLDRN